jgi:hypothetical protein
MIIVNRILLRVPERLAVIEAEDPVRVAVALMSSVGVPDLPDPQHQSVTCKGDDCAEVRKAELF